MRPCPDHSNIKTPMDDFTKLWICNEWQSTVLFLVPSLAYYNTENNSGNFRAKMKKYTCEEWKIASNFTIYPNDVEATRQE